MSIKISNAKLFLQSSFMKKTAFKYKIDDKVWLIHTAEIGIVKDFVNMHMLKIQLDEENIVPVFMDDLELYKEQDAVKSEPEIVDSKQILSEAELYFINNQNNIETGLHLSFLPVEIDDQHFFEMILVNDTNDDVQFQIKLSLNNELYMHLKNRLNRRYIYRLGDLAFDELNENPLIEITIEHNSHPLFQLSKTIKLKPKSFFKDLSSTPILNESAYNYQLGLLLNQSESRNKEIEINNALVKQVERKIKENFKKPQPEKHRHFFIDDTIDLHIENLIDSHAGMTNAEIIKIQLQHFRKCFEEAMIHKLSKFTVIHGIGKGKLRAEIWLIIKEYNAVRSFKNEFHPLYGFGATEIFFR
ncbi:MAG: hypothetical protein RL708_1599 [Bacteroidota bacterium]|jgi:hypothetical protein